MIGGKPSWYTGPHVETAQRPGPTHQWSRNFPLAMRAAVQRFDEPFWWTADDIFPMVTPQEVTYARLRDIDEYLDIWSQRRLGGYVGSFVAGITGQRDIIRALGIDTQHNADMHMPHLLHPERLDFLMSALESGFPQHPVGHFRAIYGALWPGEVVRVKDPKVMGHAMPDMNLGWISTCDTSWRARTGTFVRTTWNEPSPWEGR